MIFFLNADVVVQAAGRVTPSRESVVLYARESGSIDTIYVQDGSAVKKGQAIFSMRDEVNLVRYHQLLHEETLRAAMATELAGLIAWLSHRNNDSLQLKTDNGKIIWQQFLADEKLLLHDLGKADLEIMRNRPLFQEHIIPASEWEEKLATQTAAALRLQQYRYSAQKQWQERIEAYQAENRSKQVLRNGAEWEQKEKLAKAPGAGNIQLMAAAMPGMFVQKGEPLCRIIFGDSLVVEGFVSGIQMAIIHGNMPARIRLAAAYSHHFNSVDARVIQVDPVSIDKNGMACRRIVCRLPPHSFTLPNGFSFSWIAGIPVGITIVIARRKIWQVLFDKPDDWFKPSKSI
ncbi:hypothetical protein FPE01S_01_03030 [Flavihumibacter petaseus NBRC 106054]|uniref:Uncharacterized protein n=1 Tax=Flavihumibacter petaseus NBRC 106054 TaxID=1220578 RepID=A0A0E9MV29_9BACT|nr:hypothetical protein FPE01S_01_03030 [Flavihumibacter petaseus NBRC 106054]